LAFISDKEGFLPMSEDKKNSVQIAQSVAGFLDKHSTTLWNGIKYVYKKASDETRLNWRLGYERYLDRALNKYFYAKTFLSTNEPLPLYDFYVPLSVSCGDALVENTSIEDLMQANKFAVVMATGGSGKTMMMRHLFVDTIRKTHQLPVFVELRELNNTDSTLFELIKKKLSASKFDFSDEYIEKAFEAGHFALFLDGFDEIGFQRRNQTIKEIQEIADKYEENYIVLSSRPDDSLFQWTLFNVWQVAPLNLTLACDLVEKTEADEEIKEKFVKALRGELFEKHHSFLSNPLLLSIMLITYKDSANIPQKLSTFYERAYTALFEQHDAKKAYYREKRSKLDILEFRKVFSAFCFLTYNQRLFNFSETGFFEYLDKTQKLSGLNFNKKDFLEDAIQAVCLLIRDGLEIAFSHRSFQEYFAALYISQISSAENQRKAIERLLVSTEKQIPIFLLYEIAPEIIEKHLIIPFVRQLENEIVHKGSLGQIQYKRFIQIMLDGIGYNYEQQNLFTTKLAQPGFDLSLRSFDLQSIYHQYWRIFSNYIKDKSFPLPTGDFEAKFGRFYESQFLENHEDSLNSLTVKIDKFVENRSLFGDFAAREHIYSKRTLEDLINAKGILIKKHQEQEAFFEVELFG
jgi:hypothetical protein